ncbi:exo-beta-N-acetylmuramidase NamZ family protein [Desulfatitalea alkaliphila]|uniref:DUF1343 domain-containing protein n=1 Tax=Desulfatitalea alkaliphila TaxID=2929485 RepID=A0AA41R4L6_9BACT|nr:DUF1343 domain-containing protein [Desulfatitalea alkaliphila]MCJ8500810.1 DUF1343 domain-containing protein [Desulfatitalea alkaliphila]
MATVIPGLEKLVAAPPADLQKARLGLLCNSASVDHRLVHAARLVQACFGTRLVQLFSPQHGLFAERQDNMIESDHRRDPWLHLPVHSLYSETRRPTAAMMTPIDVLLVDLQDVGTRVYTFIYTLSYCMEAAKRFGKKVVVLDRPNPIGGQLVEGNCLVSEWASFVGRYPIPMRHGMTIGELALMFNDAFGIGCDLEVIPLEGWQRRMLFEQTGLPWVAPSPNLPTPASALVYPGQVIWEGTNVSEGRGTTQPFEIFGAPYLSPEKIMAHLKDTSLPGVVLRPMEFLPTANKWQGEVCRGFQLHVTDPARFHPFRTGLALLQAILYHHADAFRWKQPPYEYEYERLPMDLILGDQTIRTRLAGMTPVMALEATWQAPLAQFRALRERYLLY